MNTENLKQEFTKAFQDIKEELHGSRFFRKLTPVWLVVGGVILLVWVVSGGPFILASVSSMALIFTVLAALLVGPAVWVFWDSREREMKHPLGWGIFALITTPVGALVYYLIRPDAAGKLTCSGCGQAVSKAFSACPFCGVALVKPRRTCSSCHSEVEAEWRFCPYCRAEMGAQIS